MASLVSRRPEPGSLYNCVQLGLAVHLSFTCGPVSGLCADLGIAVGRTAREELEQLATVRGCHTCIRRIGGIISTCIEAGQRRHMDRGITRARSQFALDSLRAGMPPTSRTTFWR